MTRLVLFGLTFVACGGRTELGVLVQDIGASEGGTDAPYDAGTIECGVLTCNANVQYCEEVVGGPPPGVDVHACPSLFNDCHACVCAPFRQGCTCRADGERLSVICQVP